MNGDIAGTIGVAGSSAGRIIQALASEPEKLRTLQSR
jgi:hypothetical protein